MTTDDLERLYKLRARWIAYDAAFQQGYASADSVLGAYTDWVQAVAGVRESAFLARQGAKSLRSVGL